jgi:hypothetical protein
MISLQEQEQTATDEYSYYGLICGSSIGKVERMG